MTIDKLLPSLVEGIFVYDTVSYYKFQIQFLPSQDPLSNEFFESGLGREPLIIVKHTCKLEEVISCTAQI